MDPQIRQLQEQVRGLARQVETLAAEVARLSAPKPQQITLPLDPASAQVLREEMVKAGFTYP